MESKDDGSVFIVCVLLFVAFFVWLMFFAPPRAVAIWNFFIGGRY